tara:strand:+ start:10131 stop:10499 length:369 start_codon:yes stop_codon:yes gene_type:complete
MGKITYSDGRIQYSLKGKPVSKSEYDAYTRRQRIKSSLKMIAFLTVSALMVIFSIFLGYKVGNISGTVALLVNLLFWGYTLICFSGAVSSACGWGVLIGLFYYFPITLILIIISSIRIYVGI